MPKAWNNRYHVTVHAYGSWLRGDPRGWRSRNHNQHVDGDYKNRPLAGSQDRFYAHSKLLMKRAAVRVEQNLREVVLGAIVEKLAQDQVQVIIASVDGTHVHLLARFSDHQPKHWMGRAKKHSSHVLRSSGLRDKAGGLWAKCSYAVPIMDRSHQLSTFKYILAHGVRRRDLEMRSAI